MAIATIAEVLAVWLNEADASTKMLHAVIKCLDYTVTPIVAVCFIRQVFSNSKINKVLFVVLGINTVLEITSIFTGWIFYIDENNIYRHGNLYFLYMAVYFAAIFAVLYSFWLYGSQIKKENWVSLIGICIIICFGVIMQEVFDSSVRTCSIGLTIGCILQFIHFSEFCQVTSDLDIRRKKALLEKDSLTGAYSRFAYNEELKTYGDCSPDDSQVVFSIDINGLKNVNDSLGHLAGDELISGSAETIIWVLSPYGKVFRTGGDEFIALVHADAQTAQKLNAELEEKAKQFRGKWISSISFSIGYSQLQDCSVKTIDALIRLADQRMYRQKELYYQRSGIDRRAQYQSFDAICSSYTKILKVDLGTGDFEQIRVEESEVDGTKGYADNIRQWLHDFAHTDQIYKEDVKQFLQHTDIEHLRSWFDAGNQYFGFHYHRRFEKTYHENMMEIIPAADYSADKPKVYLYVKDLDR